MLSSKDISEIMSQISGYMSTGGVSPLLQVSDQKSHVTVGV